MLALAMSAAPVRADDVEESEEQKVEERLEKEVRERRDRAEKKQKSYEHTERHRKQEKTAKEGSGAKAKQERQGRPMDSKGKSAEMLERRDERKAIKGAYDEEVAGGAERVKGKKPWWKFWGSDED
jgi:hypothetical protein